MRLCALILLLFVCGGALDVCGQSRRFSRGRAPSYDRENPYITERGSIPMWDLHPDVPKDCFRWARLKYRSWTQQRSWNWYTDLPDSDLNFSYRLHQLTAMRVHPEGIIVEIDDPELFSYPFIFMNGVGGLILNDEEAAILRRYMLGGGFMMVDDFHGHTQWDYFYKAIKRVFPDREPVDLTVEHPIFHTVFDLKEAYQIPNISLGMSFRGERTWEAADWKEVHYCAVYDDKGRMMMFIGHNTDVGDGWEEEATDPFYFETFSEPKAFPLGINVLIYAMMH